MSKNKTRYATAIRGVNTKKTLRPWQLSWSSFQKVALQRALPKNIYLIAYSKGIADIE
jgi:hypothetical protein